FPGRDHAREIAELVILDLLERAAEMLAQQFALWRALLEATQTLAQRARQRARPPVGAPLPHAGRGNLVANADIAANKHRCDREIRISVRTRQTVLDSPVGDVRNWNPESA